MKETKIYVGLNDAETLSQRYDTERYLSLLKKVCYSYHIPFSLSVSEGGYFHENGDYTEETTLVLTLMDIEDGIVNDIAKDLCVFFHQESVMITSGEVRSYFIEEKL